VRSDVKTEQAYPNFVGADITPPPPEDALFHIIPVPYEKSVSYGKGTAKGPASILKASLQLELFDGESIPAEHGIYTHPPINCDEPADTILKKINESVSNVLSSKKIPIMLGGEHSITIGAVQAVKNHLGEAGVVQLDAHADLRDSYEENQFSHACVMRRISEMKLPVFQIGNRSMSIEEFMYRKDQKIGHLDASEIATGGLPEKILPPDFPRQIYLTIDVDVFDPSVIPATGTPEPGGLGWYEAMQILSLLNAEREIVAVDVVELAPISNMHSPDFSIARLIYNLLGLISRKKE
jgi:agmatinase